MIRVGQFRIYGVYLYIYGFSQLYVCQFFTITRSVYVPQDTRSGLQCRTQCGYIKRAHSISITAAWPIRFRPTLLIWDRRNGQVG